MPAPTGPIAWARSRTPTSRWCGDHPLPAGGDLRGRRRHRDLCRRPPALRPGGHGTRAVRDRRLRRHLAARLRPDHAARRRRASTCSISASPPGAASSKPARDDLLVETLAAQGVFGDVARQRIDFALEGGGIETDGDGTLLTTWRCLHERHPDVSREELTARLADMAAPGPRAVAGPRLPGGRRHRRPHRHPRPLRAGRRDRVPGLRRPGRRALRRSARRWPTRSPRCAPATASPTGCSRCRGRSPMLDEGRRLAASYANFLIVNGAVLMPAYGDAADDAAAARAGAGVPRPRDRAGALPPADLAERQPALHHHAIAGGSGLMSRYSKLPVALVQERNHGDAEANLAVIETRVAEAAKSGREARPAAGTAQRRVLLPARSRSDEFDLAEPIPGPSTAAPVGALAKQHGVVLVSSLFEKRATGLYHNTAVVFEARRLDRRQVPQDAHPGRSRASTRSSTSPRATSASIRSTPRSAASACWCAGTSGIRKARG